MSDCCRVFEFAIKNLVNGVNFVTGATLGQAHLSILKEEIGVTPVAVVIFDFKEIEFATASYLKALIFKFINPGELNQDSIVFPVLRNLSEELKAEVISVCGSERLPCMEVIDEKNGELLKARIFGNLEAPLKKTLALLQKLEGGIAENLSEISINEGIGLSAWNNRLADLYRLRLADRTKQGRYWHYKPLSKETIYGLEH
jgi:hypothetical protein